jgi:hypothetical protein
VASKCRSYLLSVASVQRTKIITPRIFKTYVCGVLFGVELHFKMISCSSFGHMSVNLLSVLIELCIKTRDVNKIMHIVVS